MCWYQSMAEELRQQAASEAAAESDKLQSEQAKADETVALKAELASLQVSEGQRTRMRSSKTLDAPADLSERR